MYLESLSSVETCANKLRLDNPVFKCHNLSFNFVANASPFISWYSIVAQNVRIPKSPRSYSVQYYVVMALL